MQVTSDYRVETFFRPRQQGAFKAGGWCYRVFLGEQCVKAGCNLRSREDAERQGSEAAVEAREQRGGAR